MMIMVGGGGGIADVGVFGHTFKRFVDCGTIWSSLREERTGTAGHLVALHLFDLWLLVWWWEGCVCVRGSTEGKEGLVVGDWRCRAVTADGWSPLSINTRGLYPPQRARDWTVPSFAVLFSPCLRRHGNPPRVYTVVANKNTPSPPLASCTSASFELYLAKFSLRFTVLALVFSLRIQMYFLRYRILY